MLHSDGYTFALPDGVERRPVRYRNRYGIEIAADLYTAVDLDRSVPHPALVIGPPHGGVKEQRPGVYASELARRGFVTLAFDPSYNGESGGEPRHVTSPELFAEDFSAGVDHLGTLDVVDRERIGAIGICGSGGFALSAASTDQRIKAVATSAMYDISGVMREGWEHGATDESRRASLTGYSAQRWADVDAGRHALQPTFPATPPEGLDPITAEFFEYYVQDQGRGWHPRSIGGFTLTSLGAHVNAGALSRLDDIAPRPILLVTGDIAHSRYFSEDVVAVTGGRAELVVVPAPGTSTSTTAPTSSPSTASSRSSPTRWLRRRSLPTRSCSDRRPTDGRGRTRPLTSTAASACPPSQATGEEGEQRRHRVGCGGGVGRRDDDEAGGQCRADRARGDATTRRPGSAPRHERPSRQDRRARRAQPRHDLVVCREVTHECRRRRGRAAGRR